MRFLLSFTVLLGVSCCGAGCGGRGDRAVARESGSGLVEEAAAPMVADIAGIASPEAVEPPAVITSEGWVQRQQQKESVLNDLRVKAATDDTGSPFVLKEKDIEELSKQEDFVIF